MSEEDNCPICLVKVADSNIVPCNHKVCVECAPTWLKNNMDKKCLICKQDMLHVTAPDGSIISISNDSVNDLNDIFNNLSLGKIIMLMIIFFMVGIIVTIIFSCIRIYDNSHSSKEFSVLLICGIIIITMFLAYAYSTQSQ